MIKKLIILLFIPFTLFSQTKYYVDEGGDDDTGDGSSGNPWASIDYAATQATTSGDTIFINDGTYAENDRIDISVGVHVVGQSQSGVNITSTYESGSNDIALFNFNSESTGVNGNQSISYMTIDGGLTARGAISVLGRSNVRIHHVEVDSFLYWGVSLSGNTSQAVGEIEDKASGNKIDSCKFVNTSVYSTYGRGAIQIGNQDGMEIHHDTLIQTHRAAGSNGYLIKMHNGLGYNENLDIYNNYFEKGNRQSGDAFDFACELGAGLGVDIYDNTFNGGSVNMGGIDLGEYEYCYQIYDNIFGFDTIQTGNNICVASEGKNLIIRNNIFKNTRYVFYHYGGADTCSNIKFYNNVCFNIGTAVTGGGNIV